MRYHVRWNSLDGTGDNGYLGGFDRKQDAVAYAEGYARSVGTVIAFPTAGGTYTLIATARDGYRERVTVTNV